MRTREQLLSEMPGRDAPGFRGLCQRESECVFRAELSRLMVGRGDYREVEEAGDDLLAQVRYHFENIPAPYRPLW